MTQTEIRALEQTVNAIRFIPRQSKLSDFFLMSEYCYLCEKHTDHQVDSVELTQRCEYCNRTSTVSQHYVDQALADLYAYEAD